MKLRKRLVSGLTAAAMLFGMAVLPADDLNRVINTLPASASDDITVPQEGLDDTTVGRVGSAVYNDNMLTQNANVEQTDLIKLGIELASSAYNKDNIETVYGGMGFSYKSYNYERTATYEDNDFVGYSLGYKKVGNNRLFLLTIRGTPDSAEWFSDFNLGSGDSHLGFSKAANDVMNSLDIYLDLYASTSKNERNTILVTGHSRGAAVANILAQYIPGAYPQYFSTSDVFGYTFACPAVKRNADKSLKNIHNYNIPGDYIPAMPLSAWGFQRNGQDHILSAEGDCYLNFLEKFKNRNDTDYKGAANIAGFEAVMEGIAPTQSAFLEKQLIFKSIAAVLASKGETYPLNKFAEYEMKILSDADLGKALSDLNARKFLDALSSGLYSTVDRASIVSNFESTYDAKYDYIKEIYDEALEVPTLYAEAKAKYEAKNKGETLTFNEWSAGRDDVNHAANTAEISITTLDDMRQAINIISGILSTLSSMKIDAVDVLNLLMSVNIKPVSTISNTASAVSDFVTGIGHAHDFNSYRLWINSQYFGVSGWSGYKGNIKKLVIPSDIKRIGIDCFDYCTNIYEVVIPDSVVRLNDAFYNCTGISKLTMPVDLVTDMNTGLSPLSVHLTYGHTGKMAEPYWNGGSAKYPMMYQNKSLAKVTFEDSITHISKCAFKNCTGLYSVQLPASLEDIGNEAFSGCISIESAIIPDGTKSLGEYCYKSCTNLLYAELPDSITTLGRGCFLEDAKLQIESELPKNLTTIGAGCFSNCKVLTEKLVIPDGIDSIGSSAFLNTPIKSVTVPADIVGYDLTNSELDNIEELVITKGKTGVIKGMDKDSFLTYFASLKKLTLEEGITTIGSRAFSEYTYTDIVLPSTVTAIGDNAFYKCTQLENMKLPSALKTIGNSAFSDCEALKTITIPDSVTELGKYAFSGCKELKEAKLSNKMSAIADYTFYNCNKLESIVVPNSVRSIGENAFDTCTQLNTVILGNSVEEIGTCAFSECSSLKEIAIPDKVTKIGSYAFYKTSLKNVSIGKGVTEISDHAFYYCSMDSVTIPKNVETIGEIAFGFEYRKISGFKIYGYTGTAAEEYANRYNFTFIPLDGAEASVTLDIALNANDKTMSAENVSISVDGEAASTSENGSAELSLADGIHEITFSAYGFVPRTYTVEVKDGKLTEELTPELDLIGDADGNGAVNTLDIVKIKRHLIKAEPLTGYALDCANADGNDTVNTLDIVKLKRHLIKVEPLW